MNRTDWPEMVTWPEQQRQIVWIVVGLVALAFVTVGMLWGLSVAFRSPVEVGYPVPGPTETRTVISGWTEQATEYIEGPTVPLSPPQDPPVEVPPPREVVRVIERPVPGPTRTVTEYRT
ncbi:MAG: hypothetical protein M3252_02785, partial [Actinomycetota bacterium]|nr:hypothetical protein [Actinomycetota bacterium]